MTFLQRRYRETEERMGVPGRHLNFTSGSGGGQVRSSPIGHRIYAHMPNYSSLLQSRSPLISIRRTIEWWPGARFHFTRSSRGEHDCAPPFTWPDH
jgi:hypothetical protein